MHHHWLCWVVRLCSDVAMVTSSSSHGVKSEGFALLFELYLF